MIGDKLFSSNFYKSRILEKFAYAMHSKSVAPASFWPQYINLEDKKLFIDIGGGLGTHSISACDNFKKLNAIILEDKEIVKLVGTTKTTILAIRNKTYWNYQNLKPRDPVLLNLCSQVELNEMLQNAKKRKILKEKTSKEQNNLTS